MKSVFTICFLALVLACSYSAAYAFHDGGVAYCAGCHTMHNSQDGAKVAATTVGNAYLLKSGNASDQCLSCHATYGQFKGGAGWGPGGDFYWLTKTYTYSSHGSNKTIKGESHGHNIISPANGLVADATLSHAPGGDFLSSRLTCTSCHDPHGRETFRLLYDDTGDGPIYGTSRYDFNNPAPEALGNSRETYAGKTGLETDAQHTIYKGGMSDWCANCHENFHSDNTNNFVHPEGALEGMADNYNAYVDTDHMLTGSQATAYRSLTPFEVVDADSTADPLNYTKGPDAGDQVMCLTCHRAHASAFPDAGRWDFGATYIVDSHPTAGDGGLGAADLTNKYYGYTFATNQRSLCNKCHAKDFGDEPRPVTP